MTTATTCSMRTSSSNNNGFSQLIVQSFSLDFSSACSQCDAVQFFLEFISFQIKTKKNKAVNLGELHVAWYSSWLQLTTWPFLTLQFCSAQKICALTRAVTSSQLLVVVENLQQQQYKHRNNYNRLKRENSGSAFVIYILVHFSFTLFKTTTYNEQS